MGRKTECPHCGEAILVGAGAADPRCTMCGESLRAVVSAPAGGTAKPSRPAVLKPPGPGTAPGQGVIAQRKCPSCGALNPVKQRECSACGVSYRRAKGAAEGDGGSFAPEKAGINAGVMGGLAMIAIAAIWFFAGRAAGRIFFYPPVLAVIGIYAVIKGIADRNLAGKK